MTDLLIHPRLLAPQIVEALKDTPAVCLLGPRQVGKTTLVKSLDPTRGYVNFDDSTLLNAARLDPSGFIQGLPERVILDEVQRVPELMPALKGAIDANRQPGRFILTGSANLLLLPGIQESLAGRIEVIYLQPLSEQEKQHANKSLLQRLIDGEITTKIQDQPSQIRSVAEAVVSGGYPEPNTRPPDRARQWHRQYLNAIIQRDVKDIANIRDGNELRRLIELFALRTGNLLNLSGLAKDLGIQRETVDKYLAILEQLFLVRRLPAWHKNQAKRLVKAAKIHIIDSGLACALRNLKMGDWQNQSDAFGGMLESFVVQQLICQSGWVDNELRFSHYRDKDQIEVDLVIEQSCNIWGVEVKKAASIQSRDGTGLAHLAEQAGSGWRGGIMLYTGNNILPLKNVPNGFAVPMDMLWRN